MNTDPGPAIGVGSIRHVRRRPTRNAFTYPGYFLRLPLRQLARQPFGSRWLAFNSRAVFAVNDADHGDGRPLLAWVESLLAEAGIAGADGEIWLHTFPRVLGHVFNPVSFWFAHRADGGLLAVVAEVNNTFGERHCYVLAHPDGRVIRWGEELVAAKAFHVSPFCRIEGTYRFRFLLARRGADERFVARIDHHDRDGLLIETSIAGRLEPATDAALASAFWRQPLFTLGVVARIHWQALRLLLKRVPFVSKPPAPDFHLSRPQP